MSENETETPTRRSIVGGLGSGVAAGATLLAAGETFAQDRTGSTGAVAQLGNPVEGHPEPPFPAQQQEWPGLAGRMEPRPNHGEESYRGAGRLTGRKALITGGDSGIGRATAIAYAREGADVAINYLEAEEADARQVIDLIRREGRKAVALPGDIRNQEFCRQMVNRAAQELGGLDILVNNAAYQQAESSFADISDEQFDQTMKTNLYAMFWITKAAMQHLPPGATIINTASVVAYDPPQQIVDYSMTKAAIVNFTKGIAKQLADRGIRVNAVAPGPFWTPLQVSGGVPPQMLPRFGADTPYGRPGQPSEIAPLFVLLARNDAGYVSGSVFGATGGGVGP